MEKKDLSVNRVSAASGFGGACVLPVSEWNGRRRGRLEKGGRSPFARLAWVPLVEGGLGD